MSSGSNKSKHTEMDILKHAVAMKNHDQVVKSLQTIDKKYTLDKIVKIAVQQQDYETLRLFMLHGYQFDMKNDIWSEENVDEFEENERETLLLGDLDCQTLRSPLHLAADDTKMTRWLLDFAGAKPNNRDFDGKTALFDAIDAKNTEVIDLLLEKGIDTSVQTIGEQQTAFAYAVEKGDMSIARHLLEQCSAIEIDASDANGFTPLRYAVDWEDLEMFSLLISKGADVSKKDKRGKSVEQYIQMQDDEIFARMLAATNNKRRRLA